MTHACRRWTVLVILAVALSACSSRKHTTADNPNTGPNPRDANSQPVAVKLPPPTADDVRKVITRMFADAVRTEEKGGPEFTVGDFNGDGSEDIAVVVRPNPAKLQEINNPQADWIIWDPTKVSLPKPHQHVLKMAADVKIEHVRRSDRLVAVIHGQGPEGWRNPQVYQAFLLRNLGGSSVAERLGGLPFQTKPEDALPETVKGIPGYVYWLGTVYAWQPKTNIRLQLATFTVSKAERVSDHSKSKEGNRQR